MIFTRIGFFTIDDESIGKSCDIFCFVVCRAFAIYGVCQAVTTAYFGTLMCKT